ncbi:hypothetical protein H4P12_18395 [Paracoccus sp. 11-3]|uniref:AAA domain-containing protein n=1 Tax=Paracoccus amoyensis TaxID=2760093 RepID=A0A926GCU1_9RHOB|nr:DEAD/DEAH box helicase [Paracoccus amoyensis]MBC9248628.1 hypothetical protein [Paracoccus amoyensis]
MLNRSETEAISAQFTDVLQFWHRLEFFSPFDLDKRVEPSERKHILWLREDDLQEDLAKLAAYTPPPGKRITSAYLFAGVFNMDAVERFANELAPASDGADAFEDAERGLPEGRSCFAQFGLGAGFGINFDDIEVSTLPWAMGQCRKSGLNALGHRAYHSSQQRLKDDFRRIRDLASADMAAPLAKATILDVLAALETWANFELSRGDIPVACVEINLGDAKPGKAKADTSPEEVSEPSAVDGYVGISTEDTEIDEVKEPDDLQIGILNSFFITDLEAAMDRVEQGGDFCALTPYLMARPEDTPIDLYGADGADAVRQGLSPELSNRGRWMSPPDNAMSLMQQFAINKVIAMRNGQGLFSVNGPPGTGKTTLLRDIIADNIVARAEILSRYRKASEAFETQKIKYDDGQGHSATVSILKDELAGFGMVVASSNNAAVENISRDLPKASSITAPEGFGYLRPVAHKLATQKPDGTFENLPDRDRPWGLIAAALGKKANRRLFRDRVYIPVKATPETDGGNIVSPLTIWQWAKNYAGPSFAKASAAFREQSKLVEEETTKAARFAELGNVLAMHTLDSFVTGHRRKLEDAALRVDHAEDELEQSKKLVTALERDLDDLKEEERLLDRQRPVWWSRLLGRPAAQAHRMRVQENADRQIGLRRRLGEARANADAEKPRQLRLANAALQEATDDLAAAEDKFRGMEAEFQNLNQQGYTLPATGLDDFEQEAVQISGLWHSERLASARSSLTCAALTLHEAWLAEVIQTGRGFGGNIVAVGHLLDGYIVDDPAPIWESLFMVVPVISTTFASFARQFTDMGAGSLGWVFIDEAGQAVPQAAVGALMRARRAVAIGDPLQIEPVFTLPKGLIDTLARLSPATADGAWSPDRKSVQVLADQSNRFGASISTDGDETIWIGSPLRVHRRCSDPMFSLANEIAYQGKMVFGGKERLPVGDVTPDLGPSAWIDIRGKAVGKQNVPAQVEFMAELVHRASLQQGQLPDLYVISPFKEVATAMKEAFWKMDWHHLRLTKRELTKWLGQRVGTVHTFQGKEEETVFMVLGVDATKPGAAGWAASKPNLLNVALTRAKRRFYAVGNHELWSQMPGFNLVARELPVLTPQDALRRIEKTEAAEDVL